MCVLNLAQKDVSVHTQTYVNSIKGTLKEINLL